jgi:TPR repeat protein
MKQDADKGNAHSQFNYGNCLKKGEGVRKDLKEAARCYKMSADQGNANGQVNYARCLQSGEGVSNNGVSVGGKQLLQKYTTFNAISNAISSPKEIRRITFKHNFTGYVYSFNPSNALKKLFCHINYRIIISK